MKKGILLAAFGSSNPDARRTLTGFEDKVRNAFPDVPVRWAFTSGFIRHKLAGEGTKTDSVRKGLDKMWFEKYTHVVVQSLHVVPGAEFNDLLEEAKAMAPGGSAGPKRWFERILVGPPLLDTEEDFELAARAVLKHLPEERTPGQPVVLMGHGTWHQGDSCYERLARIIRSHDPLIHIATMGGKLTIEAVLPALAVPDAPTVWLMPFLAVAGAHVVKDMAGDHPESWKSILTRAGVPCRTVLKGAAEYEAFADIWISHLRRVMSRLGTDGDGGEGGRD